MTDNEQAEAVVDGLAEQVRLVCACARLHTVPKPSQDPTIVAEEISAICDCGLTWVAQRGYDKGLACWIWAVHYV